MEYVDDSSNDKDEKDLPDISDSCELRLGQPEGFQRPYAFWLVHLEQKIAPILFGKAHRVFVTARL